MKKQNSAPDNAEKEQNCFGVHDAETRMKRHLKNRIILNNSFKMPLSYLVEKQLKKTNKKYINLDIF